MEKEKEKSETPTLDEFKGVLRDSKAKVSFFGELLKSTLEVTDSWSKSFDNLIGKIKYKIKYHGTMKGYLDMITRLNPELKKSYNKRKHARKEFKRFKPQMRENKHLIREGKFKEE